MISPHAPSRASAIIVIIIISIAHVFPAKPRHVTHFMLTKPGREGNSISGPAHTQTEATDRIFNLRGIQGCHAHHECKADSHSHFIWPGHKQRISSEAALIRPFRGKFMPATSAVKWPKKWEKSKHTAKKYPRALRNGKLQVMASNIDT